MKKDATREDALGDWDRLKDMKVKKDYVTWKKKQYTPTHE